MVYSPVENLFINWWFGGSPISYFRKPAYDRKAPENMGISLNGGTPKWIVYLRKYHWNRWFGGTPISGNLHMGTYLWKIWYKHHLIGKESLDIMAQELDGTGTGVPHLPWWTCWACWAMNHFFLVFPPQTKRFLGPSGLRCPWQYLLLTLQWTFLESFQHDETVQAVAGRPLHKMVKMFLRPCTLLNPLRRDVGKEVSEKWFTIQLCELMKWWNLSTCEDTLFSSKYSRVGLRMLVWGCLILREKKQTGNDSLFPAMFAEPQSSEWYPPWLVFHLTRINSPMFQICSTWWCF